MEVILIKDVEGLGQYGEIKTVKDGFGRNYLIPKGLAVPATPQARKKIAKEKERYLKEKEKRVEEIKKIKNSLENIVLEFKVKVIDEKMFGSITNMDVSREIFNKTKIEIDKRDIQMEPIHNLGEYKAKIKLGEGIKAEIKIIVNKE